jgi:hypothetical protein
MESLSDVSGTFSSSSSGLVDVMKLTPT